MFQGERGLPAGRSCPGKAPVTIKGTSTFTAGGVRAALFIPNNKIKGTAQYTFFLKPSEEDRCSYLTTREWRASPDSQGRWKRAAIEHLQLGACHPSGELRTAEAPQHPWFAPAVCPWFTWQNGWETRTAGMLQPAALATPGPFPAEEWWPREFIARQTKTHTRFVPL